MRSNLVLVIIVGCIIGCLSCTGESIGRKIDPDYDAYLNNRTPEQEKKDEEDQKKVRTNQNANVRDSESERELDSKFDSMAREQRQKDQNK